MTCSARWTNGVGVSRENLATTVNGKTSIMCGFCGSRSALFAGDFTATSALLQRWLDRHKCGRVGLR